MILRVHLHAYTHAYIPTYLPTYIHVYTCIYICMQNAVCIHIDTMYVHGIEAPPECIQSFQNHLMVEYTLHHTGVLIMVCAQHASKNQ